MNTAAVTATPAELHARAKEAANIAAEAVRHARAMESTPEAAEARRAEAAALGALIDTDQLAAHFCAFGRSVDTNPDVREDGLEDWASERISMICYMAPALFAFFVEQRPALEKIDATLNEVADEWWAAQGASLGHEREEFLVKATVQRGALTWLGVDCWGLRLGFSWPDHQAGVVVDYFGQTKLVKYEQLR